MKALGIVVSDKKIFENCILNNFGTCRGPPRDHSWKFGQNPMSGFRGEDV